MTANINNVRTEIIHDFGVFLPISGGMGASIDDPIVVEKRLPILIEGSKEEFQKSPVKVESLYLDCIFAGRKVSYRKSRQELLEHNGKTIDRLTHEVEVTENGETFVREESYYFDISQFFAETYKLNENQIKVVNESQEDVKKGKFLTDKEADKEIDEWLGK